MWELGANHSTGFQTSQVFYIAASLQKLITAGLWRRMLSHGGKIVEKNATAWWRDCREGCYQSGRPGTLQSFDLEPPS